MFSRTSSASRSFAAGCSSIASVDCGSKPSAPTRPAKRNIASCRTSNGSTDRKLWMGASGVDGASLRDPATPAVGLAAEPSTTGTADETADASGTPPRTDSAKASATPAAPRP